MWKRFILYSTLTVVMCGTAGVATSQTPFPSPDRTLRIVVPFPAGSGSDALTRVIAQELQPRLGAPVVVDNRAGANGQIGAQHVAQAAADGYTVLLATNSTHSANPFLFKSLRYNPLSDFEPIGLILVNPLILVVRADAPYTSAARLLSEARQRPGELTYGYGNTGGQVSGAMFGTIGRVHARAIPYKGTPGALADLTGGLLDFMIVDYPASRPFLDSGRIRPLGTTGQRRLPTLPHLPTLHEVPGLPGYELVAWLGLLAPKGTPASTVARLNQALQEVLKVPSVRDRLQAMGTEVTPGSPQEFAVFMREQTEIWRARIAEAGITPE